MFHYLKPHKETIIDSDREMMAKADSTESTKNIEHENSQQQ